MTYQVPPKLVGVKDGGQLGCKGDSEEDMKFLRSVYRAVSLNHLNQSLNGS
jgi:hypothetical protein